MSVSKFIYSYAIVLFITTVVAQADCPDLGVICVRPNHEPIVTPEYLIINQKGRGIFKLNCQPCHEGENCGRTVEKYRKRCLELGGRIPLWPNVERKGDRAIMDGNEYLKWWRIRPDYRGKRNDWFGREYPVPPLLHPQRPFPPVGTTRLQQHELEALINEPAPADAVVH